MSKNIHVLIFPAGEVNSVELHDALATTVNVTVYGGSSVDRHGPYIFKNYIGGIPLITDETFFDKFNKLLREYEIDVVFPTHDAVATFFADNLDKIKAKVIVGDKQTAAVCRDKRKTAELFADCDFMPVVYSRPEDVVLPAFAKPRLGGGSVGARKLETPADLAAVDFDAEIVAEYLPGEEYTIDCLTDKDGRLRLVSPRSRDRTLGGISVAGRTQALTDDIQRMAEAINRRLAFTGLWFFQAKKNAAGIFKLLEISTRAAGTMCLTRARGANLPLLSVYAALGYDIEVLLNPYNVTVDRTLINRYRIDYEYDRVYFDLDDTLIVDGRVHPYAIMFLYQCKNAGKPVVLLTRHEHDLDATLARHGIAKSLFSQVVHLDGQGEKLAHINPERAIFVDNAFKERKLVFDKFHIPVFDVDAIEVLLDWRT